MPVPQKSTIALGPLGPWLPQRAEIKQIDPHAASEILKHCNTRNRSFRMGVVTRIRASLIAGEWMLNGETLIFSSEGVLLDGQNRLRACAESGVAIKTWVMFGADPQVFQTIDRGASRDLGDDFSIMGEKNCKSLAAAVRLVYAYQNGTRSLTVLAPTVLNSEMLEYLDQNPGIRDSVTAAVGPLRHLPLQGRLISAAHYLFGLKDPNLRDHFFDRLNTGAEMELGDPILALRSRLFMDRSQPTRKQDRIPATMTQLWLMIRAWNFSRQGASNVTKIIVPTTEGIGGRRQIANLPEIE